MEEQYEYDTPSDSDDEQCPHENVWNEVYKRITVSQGQISVKIDKNDDPSVLTFLSDIIQQGVSGEFLSFQLQIEQQHNAIVWNPSKGNRIKDMRRLEQLCDESTEPRTSEVSGLEIPNANGFDFTFPNLKFVTIGDPDKKLIEKLRKLTKLEYLTIEGNMPLFTILNGFDSLELLTLKNISSTSINRLCTTASSRYIAIHIVNMQVSVYLAELFKKNHIQCTNVTVNCEKKSLGYWEWREETNKNSK
tara:strand:+ start:292 stop:1035 length:744 start_codon:yes stop_codon:yes gene_type:complete